MRALRMKLPQHDISRYALAFLLVSRNLLR